MRVTAGQSSHVFQANLSSEATVSRFEFFGQSAPMGLGSPHHQEMIFLPAPRASIGAARKKCSGSGA